MTIITVFYLGGVLGAIAGGIMRPVSLRQWVTACVIWFVWLIAKAVAVAADHVTGWMDRRAGR